MRKQINDEALRKLWSTSLPGKVIADRLGHHRGVLYKRAKRLGLPPRGAARQGRE